MCRRCILVHDVEHKSHHPDIVQYHIEIVQGRENCALRGGKATGGEMDGEKVTFCVRQHDRPFQKMLKLLKG